MPSKTGTHLPNPCPRTRTRLHFLLDHCLTHTRCIRRTLTRAYYGMGSLVLSYFVLLADTYMIRGRPYLCLAGGLPILHHPILCHAAGHKFEMNIRVRVQDTIWSLTTHHQPSPTPLNNVLSGRDACFPLPMHCSLWDKIGGHVIGHHLS